MAVAQVRKSATATVQAWGARSAQATVHGLGFPKVAAEATPRAEPLVL